MTIPLVLLVWDLLRLTSTNAFWSMWKYLCQYRLTLYFITLRPRGVIGNSKEMGIPPVNINFSSNYWLYFMYNINFQWACKKSKHFWGYTAKQQHAYITPYPIYIRSSITTIICVSSLPLLHYGINRSLLCFLSFQSFFLANLPLPNIIIALFCARTNILVR